MAIPEVIKYKIPRFWGDDFKRLDYIQEPFNDPASVELWRSQGYTAKFTGDMCDMRHTLPSWSRRIVDIYRELGWQNIGLSFYRMPTMTVLPVHQDLYKKYIELFGLQGRETTIRRALILLEDWQSGHYLEVNGSPILNWKAGDTVEWVYNTPHMAANIGIADRYTLQVTGHYDIKLQ